MSAWLIGILAAIGGALAALLGGALGRRTRKPAARPEIVVADAEQAQAEQEADREALQQEEQRIDQETTARLEKPAPDRRDFEQLQAELGELERQYEEDQDR